eukprot:2677785-Pyramimonas_sp.AAC.1
MDDRNVPGMSIGCCCCSPLLLPMRCGAVPFTTKRSAPTWGILLMCALFLAVRYFPAETGTPLKPSA